MDVMYIPLCLSSDIKVYHHVTEYPWGSITNSDLRRSWINIPRPTNVKHFKISSRETFLSFLLETLMCTIIYVWFYFAKISYSSKIVMYFFVQFSNFMVFKVLIFSKDRKILLENIYKFWTQRYFELRAWAQTPLRSELLNVF